MLKINLNSHKKNNKLQNINELVQTPISNNKANAQIKKSASSCKDNQQSPTHNKSEKNTYGESVIGISHAKMQRSIQDTENEPLYHAQKKIQRACFDSTASLEVQGEGKPAVTRKYDLRSVVPESQHSDADNEVSVQANISEMNVKQSSLNYNAAQSKWNGNETIAKDQNLNTKKVLEGLRIEGKAFASGGQGSIYSLLDQKNQEYIGKVFINKNDLEKEHQAYIKIGAHSNIVTYHGIAQINGVDHLVIERVKGNDLRKFIENVDNFCKRCTHPKDVEYVAALRLMLIEQLTDVLNHLEEKGISHSDLKPENILLSENAQLKLIDFGLSKPRNQLANGNVTGTIHYIAPEIIVAKKNGTTAYNYTKADNYAAANIILELLTGFYLKQSGDQFAHHSEGHAGNFFAEIMASGQNFLASGKPIPDILSSSGHFFPSKYNHHGNYQELHNNIIKPLQNICNENRSDIKKINQIVKKMVDKYLTEEIKKQAISLFSEINKLKFADTIKKEFQSVIARGYRLRDTSDGSNATSVD